MANRVQEKIKGTPMRDMPVNSVVFTVTKMDDETTHEVRETYYTKISETKYLHHGCIQGDPELLVEEDDRPRYINVVYPTGFEYDLIPTLPVFMLSHSRFAKFFPRTS